jgi:hypothetical protein
MKNAGQARRLSGVSRNCSLTQADSSYAQNGREVNRAARKGRGFFGCFAARLSRPFCGLKTIITGLSKRFPVS